MQCTLFVRYRSQWLLLALLLWGIATDLTAQTFGGLSSNITWHQINTDTCRIIFPSHLGAQAQRVANLVHLMRRRFSDEFDDQIYKIDIVLNNQGTIANGSVSIAPWKSHFLTTPSQHSYQLSALPWLDLLSIHEYRHVAQISNTRRGVSKLLYYLFGQESWAGASGLAIPDWYYEGDAVWAETQFTRQGRGRIPNFLKGYRALAADEQKYTYRKARNGSIKDYVPDHYRLGYLMTAYGRDQYGDQLWSKALQDAAQYKGLVYPFSNALKRQTQLSTEGMYDQMISTNYEKWGKVMGSMHTGHLKIPVQRPKTYTDYLYPKLTSDGSMIFYRESYEKIGAFYQLHLDGSIQRLAWRGRSLSRYYGFNRGWLAWTEYDSHARWTEQDYSNIILFDSESGKRSKVTTRSKYFAPHPNATGDKIVAVWQGEDLSSELHIVEVVSGKVLKRLDLGTDWVFNYPQWNATEDQIVVAVRGDAGEMGIVSIEVQTGMYELIVPFSNRLIGTLQVVGNKVVFSTYSGFSEQIHVTSMVDQVTEVLTDEPNGAFQPFLTRDSLYYTTFTRMGHQIRMVPIEMGTTTSRRNQGTQHKQIAIRYQNDILSAVPGVNYPVQKYHALNHAFNLHTWGFDLDDPVISLRALSNNVLNNVEASAGIRYNYDTEIFSPLARLEIATFYPTVILEASTLQREAATGRDVDNWRETNLFGGLGLDLSFPSSVYYQSLRPFVAYNHTFLSGDRDFDISSSIAQITYVRQRLQARKHLFTRDGQYVRLRWSEALDQRRARQLQIRTAWSFPGLGATHNLILHGDYKGDLSDGTYQFSSGLSQRGVGVVSGEKVYKLSGNYHLPLAYPDWGWAGLFYIYRIRSNLWFEHTTSKNGDSTRAINTAGVEMVLDLNLGNTQPVSVGIRYASSMDGKSLPNALEFFIPIYRF